MKYIHVMALQLPLYYILVHTIVPAGRPLQTTVSKNPKKPQQRPPAAVAATAATAWRVKIGDSILGTLNIGIPAASVTSNIASVTSNITYIHT